MKNKTLFFARDPGGAAAIAPVIAAFLGKGYPCAVHAKDYAARVFASAGIDAKLFAGGSARSAGILLERERPALVFTGTSADDMTERYLWRAAEARGIPSVALLDHWVNYGIRFSEYFLADMHKYARNRRHPYLPREIFVMDAYARKCLAGEGVPARRVVVTGQPNIAAIPGRCLAAAPAATKLRKAWGVKSGERALLFASEPLRAQLGGAACARLGYDERTTLEAICRGLQSLPGAAPARLRLIVRPHPKEDIAEIRKAIRRTGLENATVSRDGDSAAAISAADAVCGMASMMLIEAAVSGKPVFSVQIGRKGPGTFILERRRIISAAVTQSALESLLSSAAAGRGALLREFKVVERPVDRILKKVEPILWHR